MSDTDRVREILSRQGDLQDRVRARRLGDHPPTYLGQVYNGGSIPTSAGRIALTRPVDFDGNETEGATAATTTDGSLTVPVLVLSGVPIAGQNLIAREVGGLWVSQLKTATVACSANLTVNVKCGGVNLSGVTVSVTLGSTTIAGTTNASGNAVLVLTASGTWSGTISKAGYATIAFTQVFSCTNVTKNLGTWLSPVTFAGRVKGCGFLPVPGATVTLVQSSVTIGTATTDASGNYSITVASDGTNITQTVSKTRYNSLIQTLSGAWCSTPTSLVTDVRLVATTTGYSCDCCGAIPVPDTLYLTDMFGNTVTLGGVSGAWTGSATANVLAKTDCLGNTAVATVTFNYTFCDGAFVSGSPCVIGASIRSCAIGDGVLADFAGPSRPNAYEYLVTSYTNVPFSASGTMSYYDGTDTQIFGGFTITE